MQQLGPPMRWARHLSSYPGHKPVPQFGYATPVLRSCAERSLSLFTLPGLRLARARFRPDLASSRSGATGGKGIQDGWYLSRHYYRGPSRWTKTMTEAIALPGSSNT